jgi:hypothetical protein
MDIRVIGQAVIALVGTVVVGVLLSPAAAPAKATAKTMEFLFQGGDEPFGGTPAVGLSMTGKDFKKPARVTDFAITGANWDCEPDGRIVPVDAPPVPVSRAGTIQRNEQGDLYFDVYGQILEGDSTLYTYHVVGGQHRKDPRWWIGKVRLTKHQIFDDDSYIFCNLEGADADSFVPWKARLVKSCPGKCESPFTAPKALSVGQ